MSDKKFSSFESWQEYYLPNFVLEQEKSKMQLPMDSLASYLAEGWTQNILKSLDTEVTENEEQ